MYGRIRKNKRNHISLYNQTGKVAPLIPMKEDNKDKRNSELFRQMHPLLIAFLFAGLDLRPKCTRGSGTNVTHRERFIKISIAIINIISWVFALLTIYGTVWIKESMPTKHIIVYQFVEILTIFLKSMLYWRCKNIVSTLKHLSHAYDKIKHNSRNRNKGVISVLVVVYPGFYIVSYGLVISSFVVKGEIQFMYFVRRRYSNVIPTTLPPYVYYLLGIIDFLLFSVNNLSTCLFIILILFVCTTLSQILQDYFKSINSLGATFEVLQKRHIAVMNTVKKVDKCLSFPIFILLGLHILLLFFIVAFFNWVASWEHNLSELEMYYYVVFIVYSIQYFVTTSVAAKVHENVQNIKIEAGKISSRPSKLTAVEQILLIAKINSHSNICLTVWGFLNITKNFVFSSFGVLLTFGVLFKDL
ncbi:uncharacterized protein NPIL_462791 [Nephila pilipes]|uniref:Gustatory receptor n=1 Tax=Nephila pilipes TaxID=299642 RepID=A0A8X6TSD3_NEPPI|nr:uncharacterized protein NPIL_462791 [Nephila pilipes]